MVDFLRYTKVYAAISFIVIAVGLATIALSGFRIGIDFTGGTTFEYTVPTDKKIAPQMLDIVMKAKHIPSAEITPTSHGYLVKTKPLDQLGVASVEAAFREAFNNSATLVAQETVGPTLGAEMVRKTIIACLLAIGGILLYITYSFNKKEYAFAAIIALIHDLLVVLGLYAVLSHFFGAEINTLFVTAILTTMSFSVHDTIVIFDKFREFSRTMRKESLTTIANMALTQTLVRSYNNSIASLITLVALLFIGNLSIKFFLAALAIGIITGTYSSPFVATPVLVWLLKRSKRP